MSNLSSAGDPYFFVLNPASGHSDSESARVTIERLLTDASLRFEFIEFSDGAGLPNAAKDAARKAKESGGTLVACGGDGTINAVAAEALAADVPLGVIPQGTFNYFGRAYGISSDLDQAVKRMLASPARSACVGLVNDKVFLVNASIGLYPKVLEDRESWKQSLGRHRVVAIVAAMVTLMRYHRMLSLALKTEHDRSRHAVKTPTLVVCNNPIQLARLGIDDSGTVGNGQLMAITLAPISKLGLLKLILTGALGQLGVATEVAAQRCVQLEASLGGRRFRRPIKVALDGEICRMSLPLNFSVASTPLRLRASGPASADGDPG